MKLKMKKNIQTLTAIVGLGIMSATMTSCGDSVKANSSSSESIFDSYDKYFPKRSEVVDSSSESIFDSYDKYFPKRDGTTSSSNGVVSKSVKVKKFKSKKSIIQNYANPQTSKNEYTLTEPVDNPSSKKLIGDAQACDLLGVEHQTKLYRPPAVDFPRSASYVTTAKAYEEVLLPAIRDRIKSGMSTQDAMFDVFSNADARNDQVVTMAEAKVFLHSNQYQ